MSRRIQKNSRKPRNSITPPPLQFCPAVSVIIPMYNAEKYIGECLDSILAQTFKNFEVIVVDDCSTDNSPAIVENYREKFGGRLKFSRMDKNSGKPSLPRNKGLSISRGEYIYFMDNDDLITPTALEELYTRAKNYDADVVYCEKYYATDEDTITIRPTSFQKKILVDKPTQEPEPLLERMNKIMQDLYPPMPWVYFVRRDLLTKHEISFPNIIRDDSIWSWNVIFCAKKILCVPNTIYYWRNVKNSITRSKKTPPQEMIFWLNPIILGMKIWNETLNRIDFFQKNPRYHYAMLSHFVEGSFSCLFETSFKLEPVSFYEAIRSRFSTDLGEQDVLVSALCTLVNTQQKMFAINQQKFNEFAAQAQKRIAELEAQLKTK